MTQIVLDAATREKLQRAEGSVEFVDPAGNLLGTFLPLIPPPYDPKWIPQISPEEEERLASQPGKYTTEEVLRHLRSL